MENKNHLELLVHRYLNNLATTKELEAFVHLYKSGVLDDILDQQLNLTGGAFHESKQVIPLRWWSKVAAAVVVALISCLFYIHQEELSVLFGTNEIVQVSTGTQEIKSIRMPDGSVITLNRNSILRFAKAWQDTEREVSLVKGEAFFEIKKTIDKQPFRVKTRQGMEINVLGTEFNVTQREKATYIYLEGGKIQLRTLGSKTLVSPGELAIFSLTRNQVDIQKAEGAPWTSWKSNVFYFEDEVLSKVAMELEDYYGIKILLPADGTDQLRFTGKISRNSLATVLNVIGETLNLSVKQKGPIVEFQTIK